MARDFGQLHTLICLYMQVHDHVHTLHTTVLDNLILRCLIALFERYNYVTYSFNKVIQYS